MHSFMISRPCLELARPAARISPKGELARSSLSFSLLSCLSLIQTQTCPSKCSGVTRLARRVHRRSATIAMAAMELKMIGSIIQPPDLTNSHTVTAPSKKCATLT
ncbi:hypothetical protein D9M71_712290 [compost metagenome]